MLVLFILQCGLLGFGEPKARPINRRMGPFAARPQPPLQQQQLQQQASSFTTFLLISFSSIVYYFNKFMSENIIIH